MKEFKFIEVVSQVNDDILTGDVIIISDSKLSDVIRKRIFELNSSYNGTVEILDENSLATYPLKDLAGKRVAICTSTTDAKRYRQFKTMSSVLQKLNLPEFCEFRIKEIEERA